MAQELVKSLLVEINGNPQKLKQALREAGLELKQFKEKGTKASADVADASGAAMNRAAAAGRGVASAAETIARTGKAGGEAMKQLIAQGANAAMFFGPGGAVVGAIGIASLAIAGMFARTREEIAETQRAAVDAANDLAAMDANALGARKNRLVHGDRFTQDISSIFAGGDEAKRREALRGRGVDRLRRDLIGRDAMIAALPSMEGYARLKEERDGIVAALRELEQELSIIQPLMNAQARKEAEAARITADLAKGKKDVTKATQDAAQAERELTNELDRHIEASRKLISAELATLEARVRAPFDAEIAAGDALAAKGKGGGGAGRLRREQLEQAREAAVGVARALRDADAAVARFEQLVAERGVAPLRAITDLKLGIADLRTELAGQEQDSEGYVKLLDRIADLEKKLADALARRADAQREVSSEQPKPPEPRPFAEVAREIQQAADGALQLAQNLGGAEDRTIGILRAIGQVAGNLPAMAAAVKAGSGFGIATAALPILGALSSILGDSPAEQARREELRKNTEAIKELTSKAGLLGINVTGADASRALRDARALLERRIDTGSVDYANLRKVAAGFGIELGDGLTGLREFIDALEGSIMKLGEFGAELEAQQQQAEMEIALLGITDPLQKLAIRQGAFAGRSPALDRVTAGLDLSTAEGRAQARANVAELFAIMKAGGATLGEGDLGGLSGDDLARALSQLIDALDELDSASGATDGSTVGVVSGYTGLSAAAGARLEDYNRALVSFARDAQDTRLDMLERLDTLLANLIGPIPTVPIGAAGSGGAGLVVQIAAIEIVVQVSGGGTPQGAAAAVVGVLEDSLEDSLYRAIRQAQIAAGNLSVKGTQ